MDLPNLGSFSSLDDSSKKVRKPYTISKSRESWTEPEHDKFLEALHLFDRDWKKIEAFIGSKTVIQIRSHAQKYFLKVQKSGTNEHLPPPRPKRKAAHPYPQKASKVAPVVSQEKPLLQASAAVPDAELVRRPDSSAHLGHSDASASASILRWTEDSVQNNSSQKTLTVAGNAKYAGQSVPHVYSCSSNGSSHRTRPTVLPDFAQVYSFIGSVFDPDEADHLQKLKKMDPIDIETILLLMRNLSNNLASPGFEDHQRVLSSNEIDPSDNAFVVADSYISNQSEAAA